jgi:hypothetical protein
MSQGPEIIVTVERAHEAPVVVVEPIRTVELEQDPPPGVIVIAAGNVGPPGPPGKWVSMTQSEFDALVTPDPDTLYVIIQ